MTVYSCDIWKVAAAFVVAASTAFKQNVMSVLLAKYHFYLMRRGECNKLSNCYAHCYSFTVTGLYCIRNLCMILLLGEKGDCLYFNGLLLKLQRPFQLGKMLKLLNSVYCIGTC